MAATVYDIAIEQGATFYFPRFQFGTLLVDANGDPILDGDGNMQIDVGRDFTGCTFRLQMRKSKKTTSDEFFTITSEDDEITADANGNVICVVPDEKTDAAVKDGYYDLKCYNPDQTEDRLIEGTVTVNLATTADTPPP
jgi:hypothetical protein